MDVTGLMYFWGLTIDTVSTIVIIIAIGLSVDYASHVGHTFLVKSGNRKGNYLYNSFWLYKFVAEKNVNIIFEGTMNIYNLSFQRGQ